MKKLCPICQLEIFKRPNKYCSAACYHFAKKNKQKDREYTADDFISIENYQEFLNHTKLPCLLKECSWHGVSICLHMRATHGLNKREIKQLAGFNLTSGLITPKLRKTFEDRDHCLKKGMNPEWRPDVTTLKKIKDRKYSAEGKEKLKTTPRQPLLVMEKICEVCNTPYHTNSKGGCASHRKYCSPECSKIAQKAIRSRVASSQNKHPDTPERPPSHHAPPQMADQKRTHDILAGSDS